VEPLHPELRRELLRVHPEITDSDLDEYEELTALRFTLDPSTSRGAIAEIDRARAVLTAKMPYFAAVERAFVEQQRRPTDRERATPEVRISTEPPDEGQAVR
jgi:hypothetical protein